jgi:hypothetical protein
MCFGVVVRVGLRASAFSSRFRTLRELPRALVGRAVASRGAWRAAADLPQRPRPEIAVSNRTLRLFGRVNQRKGKPEEPHEAHGQKLAQRV